MTDSNLWQAQGRYEGDQDVKVRFEPTFSPEDYVFVELSY